MKKIQHYILISTFENGNRFLKKWSGDYSQSELKASFKYIKAPSGGEFLLKKDNVSGWKIIKQYK